MKKNPLSPFISDPSNHNEYRTTLLTLEKKIWTHENNLKDIYKRLNANAFKRVINVYKHVPTFDVINNQMFAKFNGIALIGELRL